MAKRPMSEQRKFLDKNALFGLRDIVIEDVWVPEWDSWVKVKTMTASERDHFEASTVTREDGKTQLHIQGIRARLCILCMVDESGNRMFSDEDEYALGTKSGAALDRVFSAAQKLNGLTDADVKALEKNSAGDQPDALDSD